MKEDLASFEQRGDRWLPLGADQLAEMLEVVRLFGGADGAEQSPLGVRQR
jgi:hypothetical protein